MDSSRAHRWALALALLQLAVGLVLGGWHEIGGTGVEADLYGQHGPGARELLAGLPYSQIRNGPGYSALLAAALACGLDLFTFAKALAALGVAAIGYLTFLTVRALASARVALWSQGLVCLALFGFSFLATNDVPFLALASASLYFALRRPGDDLVGVALAGVFAGLAFITRYTGATLIAATLAGLLLWPCPGQRWVLRLRDATVYLGLVAVASSPWWIASLHWFGTPFHNKGYSVIAAELYAPEENRQSMDVVFQMDRRFGSVLDVIAHDPKTMARRLLLGSYEKLQLVLADVVTFPAHTLLVAGLIALLISRSIDRRRLATYFLNALLALALALAVQYQPRYSYPVLPAAMMLVGAALTHRWVGAGSGSTALRWERLLRAGAAVAVVAMLAVSTAIKSHGYLTSEPLEVLEALPVLRAQAEPTDKIVSFFPHLPFLAELKKVPPPPPTPDSATFFERLHEQAGVRFLWIDAKMLVYHPYLRPWQRGEELPAGLELLYASPARSAALFRID